MTPAEEKTIEVVNTGIANRKRIVLANKAHVLNEIKRSFTAALSRKSSMTMDTPTTGGNAWQFAIKRSNC